MSPNLSPLATMLSLNTDLLLNCLDGLSGETAVERLHGRGNSISFIALPTARLRLWIAVKTNDLNHPLFAVIK